jgi:1-acyl-sn-glycerol-3-phosphate acyltransferase
MTLDKGTSLKSLNSKIFVPFFFTMGLGAFNDNLFKSAIAIYFTYNLPRGDADFLVQLSAGLFILPFFLFSGLSGQICDKYEKSRLMQIIKIMEIIIMSLGAYAFHIGDVNLLLMTLFLMGTQSTLFGPVKYSILPQQLKGKLLLKGNSLTSMGTFIFILLGTISGGFLVSKTIVSNYHYQPIQIAVIIFAVLGYVFSLYIPTASPANVNQHLSYNLIKQTYRTMKLAHFNKKTLESIYGISWFWFFGFFFMASLPIFCRDIIRGNEFIATIYLAMISVGMGLGSIIGNKITKGNLRMGLVGLSGVALSVFAILFSTIPPIESQNLIELTKLFKTNQYYLSNLYLLLIGVFGGLLIVPLYTQLQISCPAKDRSKFIASNNIMNALFMVLAALFSIILIKFNFKINEIFLIVSLINMAIFTLYIVINPRDFYLIFFDLLIRLIYKVDIIGAEKLKTEGPIILASNHVSFIDPLILCTVTNRPMIFIMDQSYFDIKILQWFYKSAKAIPITPKKICPDGLEKAMNKTIEELMNNDVISIFPEGFITKTGQILPFKDGIMRLGQKVPELTLYPVGISGMWGSWFSRHKKGRAMNGPPRRRSFRTKLKISVGNPIKGPDIITSDVQDLVEKLRGKNL